MDTHLDLDPGRRVTSATRGDQREADTGPAQGPAARQVPARRATRLRLPQGAVFRHLRAELGVEVDARAQETALRPHRRRDPPLLPDRLEWPAGRRRRAHQDPALHRRAGQRTGRHPPRRRRPRQLPDPHHPGQRRQGPHRPVPRHLPRDPRPAHRRPAAAPAATTCSSPAGKSPTAPAACAPCSPATPPRPGCPEPIAPHQLRHFLFTWLKTQGVDDALIQPYSGHASRQSLEIYSRLALPDAQYRYDQEITKFPV